MTLHNLNKVYHDQLQDLYSACKQSLDATTELGQAASDKELQAILIEGAEGIAHAMDRLKSICASHRIDTDGVDCRGMRALVREVHAHVLNAEFSEDTTRDTMIITQYQRMVRYALAGYGCIIAFANRLELDEDARVLKAQLNATYESDHRMAEIASGYLNQRAA